MSDFDWVSFFQCLIQFAPWEYFWWHEKLSLSLFCSFCNWMWCDCKCALWHASHHHQVTWSNFCEVMSTNQEKGEKAETSIKRILTSWTILSIPGVEMKYRGVNSSPSPTPVVEALAATLTRDEKLVGPFSTLIGCIISVGMAPFILWWLDNNQKSPSLDWCKGWQFAQDTWCKLVKAALSLSLEVIQSISIGWEEESHWLELTVAQLATSSDGDHLDGCLHLSAVPSPTIQQWQWLPTCMSAFIAVALCPHHNKQPGGEKQWTASSLSPLLHLTTHSRDTRKIVFIFYSPNWSNCP